MSRDSERQPQAKTFNGPRPPLPPGPRRGPGSAPLEMWRLIAGEAVAEVAPSRGGLVTRFAVGGDEILYLDSATLADRSQKVRGGVPVLFPIAGRLTGDRFESSGRSYPLRQHGLARQAQWSVINVEAAHLTMEFRSDPATRASFPFEFSYRLTVDVGRAGYRSLVIESAIENLGKVPMPLHAGLHPYFFVPDLEKERFRIDIEAGTLHDTITGDSRPWTGQADFTVSELDVCLGELRGSSATLRVPGRAPRQLSWSGFYANMVLWTVPLKDFVCVEPWSAPADALNSGQGLLTLEPGQIGTGGFVVSV